MYSGCIRVEGSSMGLKPPHLRLVNTPVLRHGKRDAVSWLPPVRSSGVYHPGYRTNTIDIRTIDRHPLR